MQRRKNERWREQKRWRRQDGHAGRWQAEEKEQKEVSTFEEDKHPRDKGKFSSKPLSADEKKAHAAVPVKRAGIRVKTGSRPQGGDLKRVWNNKGKMNTGKKSV